MVARHVLGRLSLRLEHRAGLSVLWPALQVCTCVPQLHAPGRQPFCAPRPWEQVTGDAWDGSPALKLRALKLMFQWMVQENAALRRQSRSAGQPGTERGPELRLSRSRSFGKSGSGSGRGVRAVPHSPWQDAIDELSKVQVRLGREAMCRAGQMGFLGWEVGVGRGAGEA